MRAGGFVVVSAFAIELQTQEGMDGAGQLQSHQWAALPAELAAPFMHGGLKHIRRMTERYFGFRFWGGARRVRGVWRSGEPHLQLRFFHLPGVHGRVLLHAGRLRATGTLDVYRGYHEVRGGALVAPAALAVPRPWPADLPWVAPSAGEFIDSEKLRASYLGIFELRVERQATGCSVHARLVDFPPATHGLAARVWQRAWAPARQVANVAFLQSEIAAAAAGLGHTVHCTVHTRPGIPPRPQFQFDPASRG
jgi:hypothetical protein